MGFVGDDVEGEAWDRGSEAVLAVRGRPAKASGALSFEMSDSKVLKNCWNGASEEDCVGSCFANRS